MCDNFISVRQFFDTYGKSVREDCTNEVNSINIAINFLQNYIFSLSSMRQVAKLDVNNNMVNLTKGVYKIIGFYGKGSSDCIDFDEESCVDCCSMGLEEYGRINMNLKYSPIPLNFGNYYRPCEGDLSIQYKLPSGVTEAFVIYCPIIPEVSDELSLIEIPKSYLYLLKSILQYDKYMNEARVDNIENRPLSSFQNLLQQILKNEQEYDTIQITKVKFSNEFGNKNKR